MHRGNYSVNSFCERFVAQMGSLTVAVNPLPIVNTSYNSPLCEGSDLNFDRKHHCQRPLTIGTDPNGYSSTQQKSYYNFCSTIASGAATPLRLLLLKVAQPSGSVNVVVKCRFKSEYNCCCKIHLLFV
jgi:hypothetical protein